MSKKISHKGLHAYRLPHASELEKIYAKRWEQENNNGSVLRHLLLNTRHCDPFNPFVGGQPIELMPFNQDAAWIAATIIQWLGTSVGRSFVEECLKEEQEKRKKTGGRS